MVISIPVAICGGRCILNRVNEGGREGRREGGREERSEGGREEGRAFTFQQTRTSHN